MKPESGVENLRFIEGGKKGVTLNAPKGLAVHGDTLWVADIDAVRAFNAKTGADCRVDLRRAGATFLNDLAFGPDGARVHHRHRDQVRSTGDMSHPGPDRIFRITADRKVSVAAAGRHPAAPQRDHLGRRREPVHHRPFGGPSVFQWRLGDKTPTVIAQGPGGFDGVEMARGKLLVSSWTDSTVAGTRAAQRTR